MSKSKGFTLLELLVVIVIIGLLAGYVAPRYFGQIGKSEVQVARSQIDSLEKALDQYRLDTRHYPSAEQGLEALVAKPTNEANWSGTVPGLPARKRPHGPCSQTFPATGASRNGPNLHPRPAGLFHAHVASKRPQTLRASAQPRLQ